MSEKALQSEMGGDFLARAGGRANPLSMSLEGTNLGRSWIGLKTFELLLARKWVPLLLLGMATFVVWGQTLSFGFVWDDEFFIRDLQSIRSLTHIPAIFSRLDAQSTLPDGFCLFRPIRTAHYALLYALGQSETPQPWIYHLANVAWHGATAMMLFAVARLLLQRVRSELTEGESRVWAILIALAFAVHPVVSEVVCWAKSLDDILAAFFTLAAMRELLKLPGSAGGRWPALIYFTLAVYSKESAVPFAVLPLVILRGIHRLSWRKTALCTAGFVLVAIIFMLHRHMVIGRSSQTVPISGNYAQTLLDMFPVVPEYFRLLWGIPPFCIDYSYMRGGWSFVSLGVLGGMLLLVSLAFIGFFSLRKGGNWLVGFGLFWTAVFLLPVSNVLPMMQYMAERFLYLPLIGWLFALTGFLLVLPHRRLLLSVNFLLIVLWAGTAWTRSWIWEDAVTLFVRSSQENPKTERVEENAVAAILKVPSVRNVFSYDPRKKLLTFRHTADPASQRNALQTSEAAYRLFPENTVTLSLYGINLAVCGEPEKALPFLERAAQQEPENVSYLLNLARAGLDAKRPEVSRGALEQASTLDSENAKVLQLRFRYYWDIEDYEAARESVARLNQLVPSDENRQWLLEVEVKLQEKNRR
jgi:hypothetical protein